MSEESDAELRRRERTPHHEDCKSDGLDWWCVPACPRRNPEHAKHMAALGPLPPGMAGMKPPKRNAILIDVGKIDPDASMNESLARVQEMVRAPTRRLPRPAPLTAEQRQQLRGPTHKPIIQGGSSDLLAKAVEAVTHHEPIRYTAKDFEPRRLTPPLDQFTERRPRATPAETLNPARVIEEANQVADDLERVCRYCGKLDVPVYPMVRKCEADGYVLCIARLRCYVHGDEDCGCAQCSTCSKKGCSPQNHAGWHPDDERRG